jgi:predicted enzyme related to lactoylglutathione lyase
MSNEIMAISYDSADAAQHATFWSEVMDLELAAGASADFARLLPRTEGTPNWFFLRVPEEKTAKNRVHLDIVVRDIEAEVDRITALGGKELNRVLEDGRATLITCADPEGNEFDLVAG